MSQKIGHAHPPISIDNFRLISEPARKTPLLNQFLSLLYCSDPSGWSPSSGGLPAGFSVKCHRLSGGLSLGFTLCHRFFRGSVTPPGLVFLTSKSPAAIEPGRRCHLTPRRVDRSGAVLSCLRTRTPPNIQSGKGSL